MTHGGDRLIYFGHPITVYNTPKESELIERIQKMFRGFRIENPNQKHHREGYEKYKSQTGKGMNYFLEKVLPNMDAGIFLSFKDGMFGRGVFEEAEFIYNNKKLIYEIDNWGRIAEMVPDVSRALFLEGTIRRVRN